MKRRHTAPNLTIKTLARIAEAMGQKVVIRFVPKDPPAPPAADPHWTLAA